ncbi:MAG: phosphatase PAP2 family protein [Clostridia bacterium]|nr:phosphatase PAP2 family protein [Clostridia bacterium]
MPILYFFEGIRQTWLNKIMLVITELGNEIPFMVISIVLFWCISKQVGYFMLTSGFVGTIATQWMKLVFRISRPWIKDPKFTIVEEARAGAGGYSFPSGHTQSAASTLGVPAVSVKQRWLSIILWVLYALVAISRMYLGVHTPLDVGVSLVIGLLLIFLMRPIFRSGSSKRMYILFSVLTLIAIAYVIYTNVYPFPADVEMDNLESGTKNGYTLLGAIAGMFVAYWLDDRFIHFSVEASIPAQIVKSVVGLGLIMVIRSGLKAPLNLLFDGSMAAHAVRYFVMVVFAGAVWPITFPYICRLFPKKKK